jgi:hypothetical protein
MEPFIALLVFFLLNMQFIRKNLLIINKKIYSEWLLEKRAQRLIRLYPNYDKLIVNSWSKGDSLKKN